MTEAGARLRHEAGARIQVAKLREFNTLGVVLGYRYDDSPVVVPDGSEPGARDFLNYVPSACPGSLAPHAWLHDGSSLYDHFGSGFTLLATHDADPLVLERAAADAREAEVPLKIVQPEERVIKDLYQARYTLIRPDQHVAWRSDEWPVSPASVFRQVCGSSD